MKFNQEISISDIISSLALIATFITILQVKSQRKDSNRPYLIIDFNGKYDEYICVKSDSDITKNRENNFDFKLKNIGNGIARDIKVEINLSQLDKIKLDENLTLTEVSLDIQDKKTYISTMIINSPTYFSNLGSQEEINIKSEFSNQDNVIKQLMRYYMSKHYLLGVVNSLPIVLIKIQYKDIFNNSYEDIFSIKVTASYITEKETSYLLELSRVN